MFTALISRFRNDVEKIRILTIWQNNLRELIHSRTGLEEFASLDPTATEVLSASAPDKRSWQVYDHCAAISRLYALFESAVCDEIETYVTLLPRVTADYHALHDRVKTKHRIGIGYILGKWSESSPLYSHLAERDIAAGIADGLRTLPYTLLTDAFLVDRENFWSAVLNKIFSNLGFENAFAWVSNSPEMIEFMEQYLSDSYTAESFLNEIISYRNEAAHQTPTEIASIRMVENYCIFIRLVIEALASLLCGDLLRKGLHTGATKIVGKIIHCFSNNIYGIESVNSVQITQGDQLFVGKRRLKSSIVASLRLEREQYRTLDLSSGLQFGLKLDTTAPLHSLLYRWNL